MVWCPVCKTEHLGSKNDCPLYNKAFSLKASPILDFEAFSSPDIFVGRHNYPDIFSGVLSPISPEEDPTPLSFPEEWFKNNMSIDQVLRNRSQLVYTRFRPKNAKRLTETMQELVVSKNPTSAEFNLEKSPSFRSLSSFNAGVIANSAPVKKITITSNPKVPKNVEKTISDTDFKAGDALFSLYSSDLSNSYLINLFSAGLLGVKAQRKLVPSRWSTTAVDDIISLKLLQAVKQFEPIDTYEIYSGYYVGNKYVFILMPSIWSFEVLEKKHNTDHLWKDFEGFYSRKKYASTVTGAYYANRLAVCEYLYKRKKQASVLVLREIDDSYYAPLGVGILRELSRGVFIKKPIIAEDLNPALNIARSLLQTPIDAFARESLLLKEKKTQKSLSEF